MLQAILGLCAVMLLPRCSPARTVTTLAIHKVVVQRQILSWQTEGRAQPRRQIAGWKHRVETRKPLSEELKRALASNVSMRYNAAGNKSVEPKGCAS